mmetsp:Transcript_32872/g.93842  ORF Transcript_32872/g.93842 Transcript_32872/m.93842 type:complete len:443 (-) Transcript_32872:192-1520(-)
MVARAFASAAMAITSASALVLEYDVIGTHGASFKNGVEMKAEVSAKASSTSIGSSLKSELPRTVLTVSEQEGCGSNLTGYLITGNGMLWSDGQPGTARDLADCRARCDTVKNCVGFTTRLPRSGKMQCTTYKGLVKTDVSKAKSYTKCVRGFSCPEHDGLKGFRFSHEGTWKNGQKVQNSKSDLACAASCRGDSSCVGFTFRHDKRAVNECLHFLNAANKEGPRRDMRATTYSKCALVENQAAAVAPAMKPVLPLTKMRINKSAGILCSGGYIISSKDWWWTEYDQMSHVADAQACMEKCESFEKCVSFVYRPMESNAECYLYKGLSARVDTGSVAYTRCSRDKRCPASSSAPDGWEFSHSGTWEGGVQMPDVTIKSCSLICKADPGCAAMSWKRDGEVCSTFQSKTEASANPMPIAGAEGYSKCVVADDEPGSTSVHREWI